MSRNKNGILTVLEYILFFVVLSLSRDTLYSSIEFGFVLSSILYGIICSIIILIISLYKKRFTYQTIDRKLILVGVIAFIIPVICRSDYQMYNFSIFAYVVISIIIGLYVSFDSFMTKFSNIMVFFSVFSLMGNYAFKSLIIDSNAAKFLGVVKNINDILFVRFGFSYVVYDREYYRNFGVFREPGVYQYFLLVALIFVLFSQNRKNWFTYVKIIILIITLISTFSSAAFVVMGFTLITYLYSIRNKLQYNKITIYYILGLIVLIIIIFFYAFNYNELVRFTITKIFNNNVSSSARYGSIINNFKLFIKSPLLGNNFSTVMNASEHNTNTLFSAFAIYGFVFGMFNIILHYFFSYKISKKRFVSVLLSLTLLASNNTQFLLGNSMYWLILFSAFFNEEDSFENTMGCQHYSSRNGRLF